MISIFQFFSELLLRVSRHVTNDEKLHILGNGLGLTDYEIRSIRCNHPENINHAGYQVLQDWKKTQSTQMHETEMEEKLKIVLCSDIVGMNHVTDLYF